MFVLFVMQSYLIEVRGLKQLSSDREENEYESYLIEVRGLKLQRLKWLVCVLLVVSYRGTWIETISTNRGNIGGSRIL